MTEFNVFTATRAELHARIAELESRTAAVRQLAAENVALKSFGDTLFDMYKGLEISGGGIHDEQSVVCQQAALDAAMSAFEEIETPATDRIVAGIKADAITASLDACSDYLDTDCVMERLDISYEEAEKRTSGAIEFHGSMVNFAKQLREDAK